MGANIPPLLLACASAVVRRRVRRYDSRMRTARPLAAAALALAALVASTAPAKADDPEGTQRIDLEVDKSVPVEAPPGSTVVCDDPSIVSAELRESGGFNLTGLQVGNTLCAVRQYGALPGGLFRVNVKPKKKKEPPPDAGSPDAGAPDAGPPEPKDL
jgi:hypothetical protein